MSTSVVDVLDDQHRRVAGLFERVSAPDEDRPAILHAILRELAAHVAAERSAVRPVVDKNHIGEDLAGRLTEDYDRLENLMVLIERRKFNSPDIPDLVGQLKTAFEEHNERAARELLPGLGRLSPQEQGELGEKVSGGDALVTSHPHPHLLSLGPIADILTRVAQKWDRARDRTAVNRQHPEDEGKQHVTKVARTWEGMRPDQGLKRRDGEPDDVRPQDHRMGGA